MKSLMFKKRDWAASRLFDTHLLNAKIDALEFTIEHGYSLWIPRKILNDILVVKVGPIGQNISENSGCHIGNRLRGSMLKECKSRDDACVLSNFVHDL